MSVEAEQFDSDSDEDVTQRAPPTKVLPKDRQKQMAVSATASPDDWGETEDDDGARVTQQAKPYRRRDISREAEAVDSYGF
jgi:hypothetical protein